MKRLISEISEVSKAALIYCIDDLGHVDQAVSWTLLDLLAESSPPYDIELEQLVKEAEAGRYVASDPSLPDWSINDKNVWLVPPTAERGHICISNENAGDYSASAGGQPQQFTFEQFRLAMKHWREFKELITKEGKDNVVGRRFETPWL
jgi:hypothetical protein